MRACLVLPWIVLLTIACTPAVIAPPPAPEDPRPVFLLDHGRHPSLVLPLGDTATVRYAYGEWRWYAERKTGVLRAFPAVWWPTPAALGRRVLAVPPDSAALHGALGVGVEHLYAFEAAADRVARLRARLDSLFSLGRRDTLIHNRVYDLDFAPHPDAYWGLHNSNQVVAAWLQELGFRVEGPVLFSRWRIVPLQASCGRVASARARSHLRA